LVSLTILKTLVDQKFIKAVCVGQLEM